MDIKNAELDELRALLLAPQQRLMHQLAHRLNDPDTRIEDLSQYLAEAIQLRNSRDNRLRVALLPTVEEAIRISVQRNPGVLAEALFPVLGGAIRKAINAQLQAMMDALNQSLEAGLSLRGIQWRLESLRTGRPFGEIMLLCSLLYRVRDVFLIHRATGVLLLHRGRAATVRDPQLVPAMLTAIQDFVRDSFTGLLPAAADPAGGAADLETIQAGEFTLWIQHGPRAVLAGVVQGVAPRQLRTVFQEANEQFHREYAGALERFDGDPAPMEAAGPILDRCLLGQADQAERKRGSEAWWWTAAGLAAAALLAVSIWLGAGRWRFEKLVDQVRREEGVLVTASGASGWNRYFVEGLKDPLSADLGRYQATSGLDARQVEWRWRPYASLEPGLVARREILAAVDQLAALELRYDRAKTDPPALELDQAAQAIRRLAAASEQARKFWRVAVAGEADETGDPGVNLRIAEERAGRVRAELVARGIPPDRITIRVATGGKRRTVSFEAARL